MSSSLSMLVDFINTTETTVLTLYSYFLVLLVSYIIFRNANISAYIFSTYHASILAYYGIKGLLESDVNVVDDVVFFSFLYFLVDLILWLFAMKDTVEGKITTVLHHGTALYFWYTVFSYNSHLRHPTLALFMLLTEISTPFVNLHHIFKEFQYKGCFHKLNKIIVFFLFLFVRIIGLSWTLWSSYQTEIIDNNLYGITVFLMLNCFWFYKICKMAFRTGGSSEKAKVN